MRPKFWLERWHKNEIEFHQQEVSPGLQAYWARLGLPRGAEVFVPLCGKSRDLRWLRDRGHAVLGIEIARIAVRDFFAENGLTPTVSAQPPFERWDSDGITILCGDFFDLTPADVGRVTGVYDRAALIALPPDMRRRYVAKLGEILPAGTETLLLTLTYPQEQMPGPPFSVMQEEVRALYENEFNVELLATQDIFRAGSPLHRRGVTQLISQVYRVSKR